jgi:Restriction endonuclease
MVKKYWGFRIDTDQRSFLKQELDKGFLRMGWGNEEGQNLRNLKIDKGAKRNIAIFNNVKKGDVLLVPRLPTWDEVTVVEATQDFNEGYLYEIDKTKNDYGHIFPVKVLKSFNRTNGNVAGSIRSSLKQLQRFWNMSSLSQDIESIIAADVVSLLNKKTMSARLGISLSEAFKESFNDEVFSDKLYAAMIDHLSNEEWEYALVEGLRKIYPIPFEVKRTGGILEAQHGTDILITFPGFLGRKFGIAIQVKDYRKKVGKSPVVQVNKSVYWEDTEEIKIIQKIILITKSDRKENEDLSEFAKNNGVDVIYSDQLKDLLSIIGR